MKSKNAFLLLLFLSSTAFSQSLIIVDRSVTTQEMNLQKMTFIAEILHAGKPALNIDCEVKVKEIKQERRFSDGIHIVEMLEIRFRGSLLSSPEQRMHFPLRTKMIVQKKNSAFAGIVEEFQLQADDLNNSRFIFQHDGKGNLVWMSFENDLRTLPCRLKP